ncbi:hypothetical protein MRX96_022782 [Rhipicephalus microplus]
MRQHYDILWEALIYQAYKWSDGCRRVDTASPSGLFHFYGDSFANQFIRFECFVIGTIACCTDDTPASIGLNKFDAASVLFDAAERDPALRLVRVVLRSLHDENGYNGGPLA